MRKIRLLIVDDHAIVRESLTAVLARQPDIEVVADAGNGRDAITLAAQHMPDIALLDITLGDMTGIDVARHILQDLPDLKIIFLTMHEDSEFFYEALRVGASGYVLKGARTDVLLYAIRSVNMGGIYLSPQLARDLVDELIATAPLVQTTEENLSNREKEVLVLIARGYTNREIAEQLTVSINTIKTHRLNIYQKLNLKGQSSLLAYALANGLLHPSEN